MFRSEYEDNCWNYVYKMYNFVLKGTILLEIDRIQEHRNFLFKDVILLTRV